LIEAADHFEREAGLGKALRRRQQGEPAEIINIA
jgi:hypothetical protein